MYESLLFLPQKSPEPLCACIYSISVSLSVYLYHFPPRLSRELSPTCDSALRESDWHFTVSVGGCALSASDTYSELLFFFFECFVADM